MTTIHAQGLDHKALNEAIRTASGDCTVDGCLGQRFIASGMSGIELTLEGVPGNALGAYLNGAKISVIVTNERSVGVDVPEDIELVEKLIREKR